MQNINHPRREDQFIGPQKEDSRGEGEGDVLGFDP